MVARNLLNSHIRPKWVMGSRSFSKSFTELFDDRFEMLVRFAKCD